MSRQRMLVVLALLVLAGALAWSARPHDVTAADRVDRITSELRCVVCQGLSVRESPAESARQMRDLVAKRVAEGRSDDEIRDEFRRSYGDWVLLSPPLASWTAFVWVVPFVVLAAGLVLALRRVRPASGPTSAPTAAELALLHERVRHEEALE